MLTRFVSHLFFFCLSRFSAGVLEEAGVPVAAPSANLFGHVSPTAAAHVLHDLGDVEDLAVVDGGAGACAVGIESTVVKIVGADQVGGGGGDGGGEAEVVVFRRGGVSQRALERAGHYCEHGARAIGPSRWVRR